MTKTTTPTIVIEGLTVDGRKFRPSDWAERISGNLSTFDNRRIHYSALVRPAIKNGVKCVLLDPSLQQTVPALYEEMMEFARANNLRLCHEIEED